MRRGFSGLKGMLKVPIKYSDKAVSAFGGMQLMKNFVDKTGILNRLSKVDLPLGGSNRSYDPVKLIEAYGQYLSRGESLQSL